MRVHYANFAFTHTACGRDVCYHDPQYADELSEVTCISCLRILEKEEKEAVESYVDNLKDARKNLHIINKQIISSEDKTDV